MERLAPGRSAGVRLRAGKSAADAGMATHDSVREGVGQLIRWVRDNKNLFERFNQS